MNKGFALIIPVILIALASTPQTPTPTSTQKPVVISSVLNVTDILSNPESYLGKRIKVKGKLVIHTYDSAIACPATNPKCNTEIKPPTLHLVNPSSQWEVTNVLDLYKQDSSGYTQISCPDRNSLTCGQYQINSETTLEGLFTKEQVPYQQVGTSTGKIETIKYQDHFFLVVD